MSAISTRTALVGQAVIGEIGNALEPKVNLTHRIRGQGSAIGIVDPDRATGQWPPDSAGLRERFLGAVDDEGARLSRSIIFVDDRPRRTGDHCAYDPVRCNAEDFVHREGAKLSRIRTDV